uniref:Fas apoptotic inhibitory molecule a n=1 Tax=Cyprinus carpio TaxID=7962 RepID=A0A8C1T2I6_CYPCA
MSGDLVAVWDVALSDGVHRIEFEHGTTTGKRVIYVDGKEVIRRDWMFKLVGKETFHVGGTNTKATINIDAVSGFAYEYTLEINGQSLKKYMENRSKVTSTWLLNLDGIDCRVVLGKKYMVTGFSNTYVKSSHLYLYSHPQISKPKTVARNQNSIDDRNGEKEPWEKPGSVGGAVLLWPDKTSMAWF